MKNDKIKYKKIAVVIVLTLLIWVWADLALDERLTITNVRINMSKSAEPDIWVSFDNEPFFFIEEFVLKGPASKISSARRAKEERTLNFDFTFDPDQANLIIHGLYTENTLDFLRESYQIKRLGLMVESCEPATFTVNVEKLVQQSLPVQCLDTGGMSLNPQSIEPSNVEIYVPESYGREHPAVVKLNDSDINKARTSAIEKFPVIELPDGQMRQATESVSIKMPPVDEPLTSFKINNAKIGYCMSAITQGRYKVVQDISNLNGIIGTIEIKATPQAKEAYENMNYQVLLEIIDSDVDIEGQRREVIYNFPKRYEKDNKIQLNQTPAIAQFTLQPLPSVDTP